MRICAYGGQLEIPIERRSLWTLDFAYKEKATNRIFAACTEWRIYSCHDLNLSTTLFWHTDDVPTGLRQRNARQSPKNVCTGNQNPSCFVLLFLAYCCFQIHRETKSEISSSNLLLRRHNAPWGGGYSLWWPVRGGSVRKGYLFQASGIWKGRDFTNWSI